jgi:transposase
MQESFERLLEEYEFLTGLIDKQTGMLKGLSKTSTHRERIKILTGIPGVGLITAMQILLELQDVYRFRRADQMGAYVGLTPSIVYERRQGADGSDYWDGKRQCSDTPGGIVLVDNQKRQRDAGQV